MPAQIQRIDENTYVLRLSGVVQRSEFGHVQQRTSPDIGVGVKPRILAILENFEGWERGADWGNLDFVFSGESHEIEKIAIIGEGTWEDDALAFAGDGFRRAPVKYFLPSQEADARAWLAG